MKAARILVLAVALAAGVAAAFLIRGDEESKPAVSPLANFKITDVLIAKSDVGMGTAISSRNLQGQGRPSSTTGDNYSTGAS